MTRPLRTLIIAVFLPMLTAGQTSKYLDLIDSLTRQSALFVGKQPVKSINLNIADTFFYNEVLKDDCDCQIDERILHELIVNSKGPDTTLWSDSEIKQAILVKCREGVIKTQHAIRKFKTSGSNQTNRYRRQVHIYNKTNPSDRIITYYSRPVFDNSKQYAAVVSENGHSGLSGGGSITVFNFSGNKWVRIGTIKRWRY